MTISPLQGVAFLAYGFALWTWARWHSQHAGNAPARQHGAELLEAPEGER